MPTHTLHSNQHSMYFCTFTCYNWLNLFEIVDGYSMVYYWFDILKAKYNCDIVAYVIMPNHIHVLLHFNHENFNLNTIISNGKRFMAYEIIKKLKELKKNNILTFLAEQVSEAEYKKGQLHKVFRTSFDAKAIYSDKFLIQKLNYIHLNPVSGKWRLAKYYTDYLHSSASFYEENKVGLYQPKHFCSLRVSGDPDWTSSHNKS